MGLVKEYLQNQLVFLQKGKRQLKFPEVESSHSRNQNFI